jgi:type IV pilus assembly protein PilN
MIRINLAPPSAKRRGGFQLPSFNLGILFGAVAALLVIVLGVWWWSVSSDVKRLNQEIAENRKESERLKVLIAEGQRFRRDKELLERRVNAIDLVARNQTRPVYLLDAVLDTLPKDLWLTRMEEKGMQLRFAGAAYSATALSDFMANLKATGKFKDVDIVDAKQDLAKSPRLVTFEVITRFEP